MFAQSQRPHRGHVVAAVNCRTPHRRIVINPFTLPRRPRTVSSSASNTSGVLPPYSAHPWLKGSFVRDSRETPAMVAIIQQGIFIRTDITTLPALPNVNAASPRPPLIVDQSPRHKPVALHY